MADPEFHSPTGMHDILPDQQKYYEKITRAVKEMADFYRFQRITTPVLEDKELFERGTGTSTDVVQKQMYTVKTKNDEFAMRPEGTPGIARAYIEHGMKSWPKPVRLWYLEPFFRHEKPQAGRSREFHQFGFEVLGQQSPAIDVQVIQVFYHLLKNLKIEDLIIQINSIGCPSCRARYKEDLVDYLEDHEDDLCGDCERRLEENPLRVLDCKNQQCQPIIKDAPQIVDYLCKECHNHFKQV
ncbi:MAG: histidine--tRNA ligase, partial [Candidatus Paceibacterota bacterium]